MLPWFLLILTFLRIKCDCVILNHCNKLFVLFSKIFQLILISRIEHLILKLIQLIPLYNSEMIVHVYSIYIVFHCLSYFRICSNCFKNFHKHLFKTFTNL